MERVTIGKLRNQLSAYLRKVRAGETVLVLDRDTVVARLTPVSRHEAEDDRITRLIADGMITPPKDPKGRDKTLALLAGGPPPTTASALRALLEERDENR
jgi:antitoxin (DNA-binding transcriptional repressor) of toxin-antitoxin stability system